MVLRLRFPSFECESACLSPSFFVVLCVLSEGWKEGAGHHLSKRDRCGQKEGCSSLFSTLCGDFFKPWTFPVLDVPLLARSRVACVSNPIEKQRDFFWYLQGERQWIQVFEFGNMSSEVTVFSD